jgi:hypothetical protein
MWETMNNPKKKLDDAEVKSMLEQLKEHFGEPVLPVGRYCESFRTWEKRMEERVDRARKELFGDDYKAFNQTMHGLNRHKYVKDITDQGGKLTKRDEDIVHLRHLMDQAEAVCAVSLLISKSSLLNRLIYCGETLRTEMCPRHKGVWSGLEHYGNICPYKCHLTGWVMSPVQEAEMRASVVFPPNCSTCGGTYDKNSLSPCSDFFHCCRECYWYKGVVYYPCAEHLEDWENNADKRKEALWG